jgi:glutaminase
MMLEAGAFNEKVFKRHPEDSDNLKDTLELYFQVCSILSTNRAMSVMAATLANGGVNPWTEEVVCPSHYVRCVLPIMLSAGLYDGSGLWSYDVGVPAKSGVGGCIFMVVPNVCGISVWSPRLNKEGNSTRGVAVACELVKHVQFHSYEAFSGLYNKPKWDPTKYSFEDESTTLADLLLAASLGDISSLRKLRRCGANMCAADYDKRTALHLAATEGQKTCLQFLVDCCANMPAAEKLKIINAEDRWHGTPLDDAERRGCASCVQVLLSAGAARGKGGGVSNTPAPTRKATPTDDSKHLISAAARGDVDFLIKMAVGGVDLSFDHHDYDLRTGLHLAVASGRAACVKYLIEQAKKTGRADQIMKAQDRWGHTALDDACREGRSECEDVLRTAQREISNSK